MLVDYKEKKNKDNEKKNEQTRMESIEKLKNESFEKLIDSINKYIYKIEYPDKESKEKHKLLKEEYDQQLAKNVKIQELFIDKK